MMLETFLRECGSLWPGKELTLRQEEFYHTKMTRFSEREVEKIFDWLVEHAKYFPKIADVFEAARHCGFMDRVKPYDPHIWTPTDCRLCGGSGQLAVFFEQLFDPENRRVERHLRRVMQYESSQQVSRTQQDWTRYIYRCACPAGEVRTLESGIPRWQVAA